MFIKRKKVIMTALAAAAVFVLVTQIGASGGTVAAARAGEFPAFIPMPGVIPRGVAVDKVGNVYVSVGEVAGDLEYIQIWKFTPAGSSSFSRDRPGDDRRPHGHRQRRPLCRHGGRASQGSLAGGPAGA